MIKFDEECGPCTQVGNRLTCKTIAEICGQVRPFCESCDSKTDQNCNYGSLAQKINSLMAEAQAFWCGDPCSN